MVWAMIFGAAAVTFVLRLSFLATVKPHFLSDRFRAALRFVPPAVFAAIVLPQVLIRDDAIVLTPDNPRVFAAAGAAVIAWLTRSVVGTIAGGMLLLWLAQWWRGS